MGGIRAGLLRIPTPSTSGNLRFKWWSPGFWDPTELTGRIDLHGLMTPQIDRLRREKGVGVVI